MKRALKYILWTLVSLLVLIALLVASLYLPPVQRWAVDRLTAYLEKETGLEVKDIQYLFSSPNIYMYSGMGVHTLDMDFLVPVEGSSIPVTAADDAAEALWIPISQVNPADFGLTSIRNAVIRFLRDRDST